VAPGVERSTGPPRLGGPTGSSDRIQPRMDTNQGERQSAEVGAASSAPTSEGPADCSGKALGIDRDTLPDSSSSPIDRAYREESLHAGASPLDTGRLRRPYSRLRGKSAATRTSATPLSGSGTRVAA